MAGKSVLAEAEELIHGDRHDDYGDPRISFEKYAKAWSLIVGVPITAEQVTLMMMMLKIIRENNHHKRDNLADIAGYVGLAEWVTNPVHFDNSDWVTKEKEPN